MSKYIDADKLTAIIEANAYELTDKHNSYGVGVFVDGILQAMKEAVDECAEKVIRCCDCKYGKFHYSHEGYYDPPFCDGMHCTKHDIDTDFVDFCSFAEAQHIEEAKMDGKR